MSPVDPSVPLRLISFETIIQEALPPIDWLIEPLMAKGDRVVVYGEFGSMKSWLLLHLGLHLAAGRPWFGKFAVPQARRVLYIDEEMNERTLRRRVKRLASGAELKDAALPFQVVSRGGVRFDEAGANRLLLALEKSKCDPEVIIVEAFRRVLVGSENEAKDVSAFWRNVEPLLKAGKTFVISHHMRKPNAQGNNATRDRASGSTDILAGADTAFGIQRQGGDAISIECVKSREAEEVSPFVVSLYDEGVDSPVEMRFEGSHADFQAEGGKLQRAMALVDALLRASGPPHAVKREAILAHLEANGIAERTGERALTQMRKQGRACPAGRGSWQLATQPHAA